MHALISLHDEKYQPLGDLTWTQNKEVYAAQHGYAAICKTRGFKEGVGIGYQKIHFAKEVLESHPEYDWIWWTGTDTMITNFAVRIEDRIDNNYHFMICVDVNGLNADSFLVRNTTEGRAIINSILALEEHCSQFWDTEQRAMAMVMGLPIPGEATWDINPEVELTGDYKDVIKILPQRFMNSFNYQLYHYTDHRDKLGIDGNWQPCDWLIHWPATSLDQRIHLYSFYNQHIVK
jgi:hypothetical protein